MRKVYSFTAYMINQYIDEGDRSESRITEELTSVPQDFWMNFIKEPRISFLFMGKKKCIFFLFIFPLVSK